MNAKQFFKIVSQMRTAQKGYRASRSPYLFGEMKRLEKIVDDEILRVKAILNEKR